MVYICEVIYLIGLLFINENTSDILLIIMLPIHEILEYQRKKKNITFMQIAKQANVSYTLIYRLHTGKIKKPKPQLLEKISVILDINYDVLLTVSGYISSQNFDSAPFSVPIVDFDFLYQAFPFSEFFQKELSDQINFSNSNYLNSFGIKIDHYLLKPYFSKNDIIICYPCQIPQKNSFFLFYEKNNQKISVGKIKLIGSDIYIQSLDNQAMQSYILLDEDLSHCLVAKIIEHQVFYQC